jgi:hypothetical protein
VLHGTHKLLALLFVVSVSVRMPSRRHAIGKIYHITTYLPHTSYVCMILKQSSGCGMSRCGSEGEQATV